jgi:serine protease Do
MLGAKLDRRSRNGVLVREVPLGYPAAEGGLRSGDVILAFEGQPVSQYTDLYPLLSAADPGDTVEFLVERRGESLTVTVEMGDREELLGDR